MIRTVILASLTALLCSTALYGEDMNLNTMLKPVPLSAKFSDENYYIWGASMVRDKQGKCHLFYSRWPRKLGFSAWVTHSEVAHAIADQPLGPYTHVDVALPQRGAQYWDGLCTHNPTVHEFDGKYYLYYMGNTGDGKNTKGLNWIHRNNQRIGVAVAEHPNGPWERFDKPLIDISDDTNAPDALMVNNPSICRRPDNTYILVYKAVGKKNPPPFGGPVVHMVATSEFPTGPFLKQETPVFTSDGDSFPAEDPYIWTQDGKLWAIVKDMNGSFTKAGQSLVLFTSENGIQWQLASNPLVSRIQIDWQDKGIQELHRLERPQLWLENGVPAILFCAAQTPAQESSFNVHIPLYTVTGQEKNMMYDNKTDHWKLVWQDEFEGDALDPAKWEYEVNALGGWNGELQFYTDRQDNCRIENGVLVLQAHKENFTGIDRKNGKTETREYTSARIRSKNKGDWKYGRFEIRAKIPSGRGLWPAIWMMPTDHVYGGHWPTSGEIDIMECLGHEANTVYGTLHYGDRRPENTESGRAYRLENGIFSEEFHVFRLDWKEGEIKWYVDDHLYQTQVNWHTPAAPFPAPFDQRFHLILNLAAGGKWPGNPDDSTVFPATMLIDYVRVYERIE